MRRLIGALTVLLVLSGCGAGSEEAPAQERPSAEATPRTYSLSELAAALPRTSQVPGAEKKVFSCPGGDACKADQATVGVQLKASLTRDEVFSTYGSYVLPEDVSVAARLSTDADAAAGKVARARATEEKGFVGSFATRGKDLGDGGFTFGFKGTGTLEPATVAGWKGYVAQRAQTLTTPEGNTDSGPVARTELHLSKGSVSVQVYASVLRDDAGDLAASEELARQLFTDYVERLG
ncbi:hypothetical protein [Aeromicrobium stalagmiti]|uniref:hypothetical protein n=1 Tax=Aeromicrobium stalagmiti TaxID=2738988 RepID=UPI001567F007|nr:hypothetical protein [Aeromicrobium stalagmiti]NRQ49929.1 hypothetical protein [Aeromicrobium stalagmiti]